MQNRMIATRRLQILQVVLTVSVVTTQAGGCSKKERRTWDNGGEITDPIAMRRGWRMAAPIARALVDADAYVVTMLDSRLPSHYRWLGGGLIRNIGMAAFRKDNGALAWHRYNTLPPMVAATGLLFGYGRTGVLVARSIGDGSERWRIALPDDRGPKSRNAALSTFVPDVIVVDKRLYVGAAQQVFAVSMDGEKIGSIRACKGDGAVVDRIAWLASSKVLLVTCTKRSFYDDSDPKTLTRSGTGVILDYHPQRTEPNPRRREVETWFASVEPKSMRLLWSNVVVPNRGAYSTLPADTRDGGFVVQLRDMKTQGLLARANARTGKLSWVVKTLFQPDHDAVVVGDKTLSHRFLYRLADGQKLDNLRVKMPAGKDEYRTTVAGSGHVMFLSKHTIHELDASGEVREVATLLQSGETQIGITMLVAPLVLGDSVYYGTGSRTHVSFLEKLSLTR